ncbi:hypothetical protein [Alloactinosynnema sp. L-07]|nr:hypothetical protein [Alloactinosynnema sp. L-07]
MHRSLLYTSPRLPLPENPYDERAKGHDLTVYLAIGPSGAAPTLAGRSDVR